MRTLAQPALIYKDDGAAFLLGFFLASFGEFVGKFGSNDGTEVHRSPC
jgi:hypothetical protein